MMKNRVLPCVCPSFLHQPTTGVSRLRNACNVGHVGIKQDSWKSFDNNLRVSSSSLQVCPQHAQQLQQLNMLHACASATVSGSKQDILPYRPLLKLLTSTDTPTPRNPDAPCMVHLAFCITFGSFLWQWLIARFHAAAGDLRASFLPFLHTPGQAARLSRPPDHPVHQTNSLLVKTC